MEPALTHVALLVRDIEASRVFYAVFCGLVVVHDRGEGRHRTLWLAPAVCASETPALVLLAGGAPAPQAAADYRHLGFAVSSRAEVDRRAALALQQGCLAWAACDAPYPLGYYCGVLDPDRQVVEFSFGQPRAQTVSP